MPLLHILLSVQPLISTDLFKILLKLQYFIADGFAFIFSAPKEKYDQRQTPNFVTIAFSSEQGSSV